MNRATKITASILGVYAGILGIQHGYFETLQGNITPSSMMINAIGAPCQPDTVWHACFPALTVLPNLRLTGITAIVIGLLVLIWAAGFVHKKNVGWILGHNFNQTMLNLGMLLFFTFDLFLPLLIIFSSFARSIQNNT